MRSLPSPLEEGSSSIRDVLFRYVLVNKPFEILAGHRPPLQRRWYDLDVRKITDAPEIFDISPLLSEKTAVFPQDVPFSRELTLDFESGNRNLLLSSICTTVHLGAHT